MEDKSFQNLKATIEANIAQNQDNFTKNELVGRGLFESFLKDKGVTDYKFTEGRFDKVDCFIQAQQKWEVEIKVRSESAERFSSLFMEVAKLKAMVEVMNQGQAQEGLYINFIGRKVYIYNVRQICEELKTQKYWLSTRFCNRTTAEASGQTDKRMIELPKSLAQEYEYIEGRWAKVRP